MIAGIPPKPKRAKSKWMKGFILFEAKDDLTLSQDEAKRKRKDYFNREFKKKGKRI